NWDGDAGRLGRDVGWQLSGWRALRSIVELHALVHAGRDRRCFEPRRPWRIRNNEVRRPKTGLSLPRRRGDQGLRPAPLVETTRQGQESTWWPSVSVCNSFLAWDFA